MKNKLFKYWISSLLFICFSFSAQALQLTGRLEWVHKIEMRVLADGVIKTLNVKIGQHVKKGDVLLRMDQREAKANLLREKAFVARSIVNLDDANDELKRAKELYDRGLIADEELKDAIIKHSATLAEKESANASLALAEVALERNVLRAPISGIIVTKNAYAGGVVYKTLQKEPLIAIAPSGKMLARLLVRTNILSRYKPGQNAKVNVHGKIYKGKVYSQGVEAVRIEPGGAVYELDIIFNYSSNVLMRPSDTVTVILP